MPHVWTSLLVESQCTGASGGSSTIAGTLMTDDKWTPRLFFLPLTEFPFVMQTRRASGSHY